MPGFRSGQTQRRYALLVALIAVIAWPAGSVATPGDAPSAQVAGAACDDHPNQASAQRARDTRDADGDGVYCVIYSG
jgi:hypothetical protein